MEDWRSSSKKAIVLRVGPVGVNSFGSVFPMTQIICISNFRSLS